MSAADRPHSHHPPNSATGPDLAGFRALVAGGTGNVGRRIVSELLSVGATVAVPSRSQEKLNGLATQLELDPEARTRFIAVPGNLSDEDDGRRIVREVRSTLGGLDGAAASLGRWVAAPSLLAASRDDLEAALEDYLLAHFAVARNVIPVLDESGGSYALINGPLAFDVWSPESALVSIATAGQAMLAHALSKEMEARDGDSYVRVHEVVIHSAVGWGEEAEKRSPLKPDEIGRYVALLLSERGAGVRGERVHLKSPDQLAELAT